MEHYIDSRFPGQRNTFELRSIVYNQLPLDNVVVEMVQGTSQCWYAEVKCNLSSELDVSVFIQDYLKQNNETLKLSVRKPCGERSPYLLNNFYRCHHKTRYSSTRNAAEVKASKPSKRFKNTSCEFVMGIKVLKVPVDYSCTVSIEWNHNHSINSLEAFNFKSLCPQVTAKVEALFERGCTPAVAYLEFISELRRECQDILDFHKKKADRSLCPRRPDFNSLYRKYCDQYFGGKNGSEMFSELVQNLKRLQDDGLNVAWQLYDSEVGEPLVITFVTALMERVHSMIQHSGELVFVDSTSNLEEHNLRFFLVCTHSVAGALPLGIIITSDEKESTLAKAIDMYTGILPHNAFYGRGRQGPLVFMTDNCAELRQVLREKWNQSKILLCVFHILQQVWRWLYDKQHGISACDRVDIMKAFRDLLYSCDVGTLEENIDAIQENRAVQKYAGLQFYLEDLLGQKEEWALCYRSDLLIRGSQTNNYVESQFLVLKDTILRRTRQFNVNALLMKLFEDFEDHFKLKLMSIADGSFDGVYSHRFRGVSQGKSKANNGFSIPPDDIQQELIARCVPQGNNLFVVPSKSKDETYIVDMSIGRCECKVGSDGSPCFHQYLLWSKSIASSQNFLPVFCREERQRFAQVALGDSLDLQYYDTLHNFGEVADSCDVEVISAETTVNDVDENIRTEEAHAALDEVCQKLKKDISENKSLDFNRSIIQFSKRVGSLSQSQLLSSLFAFGASWNGRKRGKIGVQPTAISRRKSRIGSRQKQDNLGCNVKRKLADLRPRATKRPHDLALLVSENKPPAKKSGSHKMKSNTTYFSERVMKSERK